MKNINALITLALLISSCASTSTSMSSSYTSPDVEKTATPAQQKIVVYAMTANETNRAIIEDAFVRQLGSGAIASWQYLNQPIGRINHTDAEEKMKTDGYQSAMIVKLIDQQASGGQSTAVSVNPGLYYGWGGNWNGGLGISIRPGSTRRTQYSVQSSLYEVGSGSLLWSGTAVAANPKDVSGLAADVAANTVSRMHSDGIATQ